MVLPLWTGISSIISFHIQREQSFQPSKTDYLDSEADTNILKFMCLLDAN